MDRDVMLSLYRDMIRIRRFEEEAARSYTRGKMGGFLHLYIGEEAVAVGAISYSGPILINVRQRTFVCQHLARSRYSTHAPHSSHR